jgi:hypothetical protein
LRAGLNQSKKGPFEEAHVSLGRLLGFDAGNKETPGAPDPWWIVDDGLCLIFEDHSDATSASLSVEKARQVASHPRWAKENLGLAKTAEVIPILVSSVSEADTDALPHLEGVSFWPIEEFRKWAEAGLEALRRARETYPGHAGDLAWRAEARASLAAAGVDLAHLLSTLRASDAKRLLKRK